MRNDGGGNLHAVDLRDRKTDAFNRQRPFENHVARQFGRDFDSKPVVIRLPYPVKRDECARAVHMSLYDVPVEASIGPHRKFEIHQGAWLNAGERSSIPGFFGQVGAEGFASDLHCRQTNSADGNAVTPLEMFGTLSGRHGEAAGPALVNDVSYMPDFFNNSSEHDGLQKSGSQHSAKACFVEVRTDEASFTEC